MKLNKIVIVLGLIGTLVVGPNLINAHAESSSFEQEIQYGIHNGICH